MRFDVLLALTMLAAGGLQQRGSVASVNAATAPAGEPTVLSLTGNNPCTSLRVDFGDGTIQTVPIPGLPTEVRHTYAKPGTYQVRARGAGNCVGLAAMTVRVPQAGTRPAGTDTMQTRFRGMDANGDGRITRAEWRGSAQSFRVHDWNGDGVLAGDEIRAGGSRPRAQDPDYSPDQSWLNDWSDERFARLDFDNDRRITRREWPYDQEAFARVDRNRDGALTRDEFVGTAEFDDDRLDRFDYLDFNGNNRIERHEWHGGAEAFEWMDRNNDGWLTRAEVAGDDSPARDQFAMMDFNNDGRISPNEWQWSPESFDRLDRNRDGRLTRPELDATSPLGTTGTSGPIIVRAIDRWTDTGIFVRAGDVLTVNATGSIEMSGESGDPANPAGSRTGRRAPDAPLPNEPAGVLLARVGTGQPVPVGRTSQMRVTTDGRLFLGVNDDYLEDNHGEYRVVLTVRR